MTDVERRSGTRTQEHEIVIDARIEAVWKAITDGEELTRWFVEDARVEPGVGGTIWISWGGNEQGQSHIEAWEPGRKLRLRLMPFEGAPAAGSSDAQPIVEEYTLESRDGKTVLRLVQSGIPDSPEWDGFYDGTNYGWQSFFRALRHYLEHHGGKPRSIVKVVGRLPGSLEEAWTRLTGPSGFGFEPVAGQTFSTRTGLGDSVTGHVVFAKSPNGFELAIRELGDARLAHSISKGQGGNLVYTVLSLYGKSRAEVEAIETRWRDWLRNVLDLQR